MAGIQKVRQENKDPHLWNVKELKTVVKWFKHDGDAPLPPRKDGLYTRYLEMRERGECAPPTVLRPAAGLPPRHGDDDQGASSVHSVDTCDDDDADDGSRLSHGFAVEFGV